MTKQRAKIISYAIVFILIAGIAVWFYSCTAGKPQTPEEIAESERLDREISAMVCAESAVEKYLKAPSTAKFSDYEETNIIETGLEYQVSGYVDAENSFGAAIREIYIAKIKFTDDTLEKYNTLYVKLGDTVYLDEGE